MTPQIANIQNISQNQTIKAFVFLKPGEQYYSELSETYVLKIVEIGKVACGKTN